MHGFHDFCLSAVWEGNEKKKSQKKTLAHLASINGAYCTARILHLPLLSAPQPAEKLGKNRLKPCCSTGGPWWQVMGRQIPSLLFWDSQPPDSTRGPVGSSTCCLCGLLSAPPSCCKQTFELSGPLNSDRMGETHLAMLCLCCLACRKILKVVRLFSNSWQAPGCEPDFRHDRHLQECCQIQLFKSLNKQQVNTNLCQINLFLDSPSEQLCSDSL